MGAINLNEDNIDELLGSYLGECEVITQFDEEFPMIHYVSGIGPFDEFLGDKKFSETKLNHSIIIYEKAVIFNLYAKNVDVRYGVWKAEIKNIVAHHDGQIQIRSVNKFSKALRSGGLGTGLAGALITSAVGAASDKLIDLTKGVKAKEVPGSIYEIFVKDDEGNEYLLKFSCEQEMRIRTNKFFDKYFGFELSKDDPKQWCFVATACYADSEAQQVRKFRQFRDEFLCRYWSGRRFIRYYYRYSPTLAEWIKERRWSAVIIRKLVLDHLYEIICLFYPSEDKRNG